MLFPLAYKKDSHMEARGGMKDPAIQRQLSVITFLLYLSKYVFYFYDRCRYLHFQVMSLYSPVSNT